MQAVRIEFRTNVLYLRHVFGSLFRKPELISRALMIDLITQLATESSAYYQYMRAVSGRCNILENHLGEILVDPHRKSEVADQLFLTIDEELRIVREIVGMYPWEVITATPGVGEFQIILSSIGDYRVLEWTRMLELNNG